MFHYYLDVPCVPGCSMGAGMGAWMFHGCLDVPLESGCSMSAWM